MVADVKGMHWTVNIYCHLGLLLAKRIWRKVILTHFNIINHHENPITEKIWNVISWRTIVTLETKSYILLPYYYNVI